MNLKCIIIDDEPMARKVLEEYIEDVDFLELVGKAENPVKAGALLSNHKIDLILLDINMPRMSGIEFLRSSSLLPMTILTTAYTEYAIEGFDLDVIDYLVKPFSQERFLKACKKAEEYAELKSKPGNSIHDYFFVKCEGKIEKVFYEELFYVEALQNYVVLHTEGKRMIVYLTLKNMEERLPKTFLKIHKSTIVNTTKIKSIDGNELDIGMAKVYISQGLHERVMTEIVKGKLMKR